jgi:predicted amidophosphoribosyltransferase
MGKSLEYAGAGSAFKHEGVAKRLVSEFKFGGQPVLGGLMAQAALPAFLEFVSGLAPAEEILLTWVPSYRTTRRERGYNQAEVLARYLAADLPGAGCRESVVKTRRTEHQKGLDKVGRAGNLRDAFLAVPSVETARERFSAIVLIDDVYTTGATAAVVSGVLTRASSLPVYVFTFSRAVAAKSEGHD